MFDVETPAAIAITPHAPVEEEKGHSRSMRLLEVYGWFNRGRDGAMPAWLRAVVVSQPTEVDIHLAAQAWAERDPDYLDDVRILVFEEPPQDSSVFTAADIATVAQYRVRNGLLDEPWAVSQARLDRDLRD